VTRQSPITPYIMLLGTRRHMDLDAERNRNRGRPPWSRGGRPHLTWPPTSRGGRSPHVAAHLTWLTPTSGGLPPHVAAHLTWPPTSRATHLTWRAPTSRGRPPHVAAAHLTGHPPHVAGAHFTWQAPISRGRRPLTRGHATDADTHGRGLAADAGRFVMLSLGDPRSRRESCRRLAVLQGPRGRRRAVPKNGMGTLPSRRRGAGDL
jgi:hypothetical protein